MRVATGTYNGDGTLSQAITGVGFAPIAVFINGEAAVEAQMDNWLATTANTAGWAIRMNTGTPFDNRITSLDDDGFTVDDDNIDAHPNKSGQRYVYLAFG